MYDIIKKIKSETNTLHSHLEQQLEIEKLQQGLFKVEDVKNIVSLHYTFFKHHQTIMENAIQNDPTLKEFIKNYLQLHQAAFVKDENWLDESFSKSVQNDYQPELPSNGLGYLYVYIGSSLGNAYISNKLKTLSIFETQEMPHFFSIQMPKELWPTYSKYLDEKVIENNALINEIKQAYHFYTDTLQKIRLLK